MNIFKSLTTVLSLTLVPISVAQKMPDILGTIPNDVGGLIIFTTTKAKECKPEEFFVYTKDRTGKVGMAGCYNFLGEDIVVRYIDGSVYSYSIEYVKFNPDFERYLQEREQQRNQVPTT